MLHQITIDEEILRPTYVTVDLKAIEQNYFTIRKHIGHIKMMAILKANAYGHGLLPVAQLLQKLDVDYFGVAYLEEAIMLRKSDISTPILVLGGIVGDQIPYFIKYDITICASSIEKLKQIEQHAITLQKQAKVHLKIDTGMERIGMHYYSATSLLLAAEECKHCIIEGIFSHLANADQEDQDYTKLQLKRFKEVLDFYHNKPRPIIHFSNSAASLSAQRELHFDMVRVGLSLYGVNPFMHRPSPIPLVPALQWKTRVVYFKVVKPNHPVSYGSRWVTDHMTRMVTLPVGYGDGYMRAMSHRAEVIINGKKYPVRGHICMDQMMVEIGSDSAYNGDEVTLIGREGNTEIKVEDLAKWAGTIAYEILTNINTRVPRVFIS